MNILNIEHSGEDTFSLKVYAPTLTRLILKIGGLKSNDI